MVPGLHRLGCMPEPGSPRPRRGWALRRPRGSAKRGAGGCSMQGGKGRAVLRGLHKAGGMRDPGPSAAPAGKGGSSTLPMDGCKAVNSMQCSPGCVKRGACKIRGSPPSPQGMAACAPSQWMSSVKPRLGCAQCKEINSVQCSLGCIKRGARKVRGSPVKGRGLIHAPNGWLREAG